VRIHDTPIGRAAAVVALAVVGSTAMRATTVSAGVAPGLVQAVAKTHTDSQQNTWDVNPHNGQIDCGSGNVFSGACRLHVDGNDVAFASSRMTPDGLSYILTATLASGVNVERRLTIDKVEGAARYVDTFENPSAAPVSVNAVVFTQLNYQATSVFTSSAASYSGALGLQDAGLVALSYPGRPSVLFFLAMPNARVRPALSLSSMQYVSSTYPLTIGPKRAASILHGVAQRSLHGAPQADVLKKEFMPFASGRWMKKLPRSLRRTVANAGKTQTGSGAGLDVLADLDVTRSTSDTLAFGKNTRLSGTASCASVRADTRYGAVDVPLDAVAAIVGRRCEFSSPLVVLRDGHVFKGELAADGLQFALKCGSTVSLTPERIDRIVLHESENDGLRGDEIVGWVQTVDGEQLLLQDHKDNDATRIGLATPWGTCAVTLDDVESIAKTDSWSLAWLVELRDGSRFEAYIDLDAVTFHTVRFGSVALEPARIKSIRTRTVGESQQEGAVTPSAPHVLLSGNTLLVAKLDVDEITIRCMGEAVSVAPEHIKRLSQQVDASGSQRDGLIFTAELWDNGLLAGLVARTTLPIRMGGQQWLCPVRDVIEVNVPTPTVPESTRASIAEAIRNLGHPEWQTRQKASEELASHGYLAKAQMREALNSAHDAETKKRLHDLLDRIKD
jgi:hypothetical protein